MRFGHQLRSSLIQNWEWHYIDYERLKHLLPSSKGIWSDNEEQVFVKELEGDLDKVFTFQKVKSQEIIARIKHAQVQVDGVLAQIHDALVSNPSDEEFGMLEQDLELIISDVHDLAKFTQLNYTGFEKIVKKHDKLTKWHLKPVFAARLKAKPFFKDNYDAFIVKLSKLYDLVRTQGHPTVGDSAAGGTQQTFVRQTTKYWVHPDNITELKLIILKHLPVLVFNPAKEFDQQDMAISSIYYDNPDTWELYQGRLKKTEAAEAIRLRWYGGMATDTIFIERKTHREDWTGEQSVKARLSLKEKHINDFMTGKYTTRQAFQKMRKEGKKSERHINELEQLAKEIQYRVISRKLVPVTRSFYHRTAFQLPGDARVRISLDTELTMTREDNLDGCERAGNNWRRMDIGVDFPFSQLPAEDVERFPYAVLEVKLQTQAGQQPPAWIKEVTASHLVEAVPRFSKFIHGTATLFPTRIKLIPFWMPQMHVNIRKPVSHYFGVKMLSQGGGDTTTNTEDSDDESDKADDEREDDERPLNRILLAQGPNDQDDEERVGDRYVTNYDPFYDSEDEEDDLEEARRVGGWAYYRLVLLHRLKQALPYPTPTQVEYGAIGVPRHEEESIRIRAPKGKKIHVPVRVEPKVALATERTFLSWLEFSVLLSSIATVLVNFLSTSVGDEGLPTGLVSGLVFTIMAVIALLYSLGLYLWRADRISRRASVNYHDWFGPSALCGGLFFVLVVSFLSR